MIYRYFLLNGTLDELQGFITYMNNNRFNLKFKHDNSATSVS